MKLLLKIFSSFMLLAVSMCASAQNPTYNLRAMNFSSYGCPNRTIEFDVYMEHTNSPTEFEYAGGQYFFNFDPAIANGGTLTFSIVGSDLPSNMLPRSPTVSGSQLRLTTNFFPGAGNGFDMTGNGFPGTKIVRLRLSTFAIQMNGTLSLQWRSALPNPFTKIFAYVGSLNTDVSTPQTHSVIETYQANCDPFLLSSPAFNTLNIELPVSFSWYRSPSAVSYKLLVSEDTGFTSVVFSDSTITDTAAAAPILNINTTYYWKVCARNDTSYYAESQIWRFKTGNNFGGTVPTYSLVAKNFTLNGPDDNILEFDIYILHTNPPAVFEYGVGQYNLKFNPSIANGGTLTSSIVSSDLPQNQRPQFVQIREATNPEETVMAIPANASPGAGNGYRISSVYPGTKIARMRLETTAQSFALDTAGIYWRDLPIITYATKIFAYVGNASVSITTPETHSVEMNINPLPVEMSSFTYAVSRNNVVLNWQTLTESNNKSFTIERNSEGSDEWLQAGIVPGSGNSIEQSEYSFKDMNLQKGIYKYRLKQTDFNGNFSYHNLQDNISIGSPAVFNLSQNYPNPFNPVTKIDYEVPNEGIVSLLIYDISGREVKKLTTGFKPAGYYTESFDASGLSSGVYFYRLTLNANTGGREFISVKKMILMK